MRKWSYAFNNRIVSEPTATPTASNSDAVEPAVVVIPLDGHAAASHCEWTDSIAPRHTGRGIDQHLNAQIDNNLEFQDESGQPVKLGQLFQGKPVILTLVYYRCPMLCTQVLNGLLESSQAIPFEIGREYQVVSISIDPQETSAMAAAKKKRYAESYHRPGARTGWHFLTGKPDAIKTLADTVGFRYVYDPMTKQYAHASGIVLLTPNGRVSRYLYGIDYPPDDLRLALVESAADRIGTATDQFLLLCYHYDPATGKYGFAIEAAIRTAGLITVFAMGIFIWRMYRTERRRTALERRLETIVDPEHAHLEAAT